MNINEIKFDFEDHLTGPAGYSHLDSISRRKNKNFLEEVKVWKENI